LPDRIIPSGIPFAQIPHDITSDHEVTNAAFRVYALLMKLADSEGRAWPGHRYMSNHLNMTRNTIGRAIRNLAQTGWVTIIKKDQAHTYVVHGSQQTRLQLGWLNNEAGAKTEPVQKLDQTGSKTAPEPAQKLSHTDNQDRQPDTDTHLAPVKEEHNEMVWALVDAMGWARYDIPKPQWGRLHKAAKTLTEIGADPTQVSHRAQVYQVNFAGATMTPNAIATNWADLAEPRVPVTSREVNRAARKQATRVAVANIEE